MPTYLPCRRAGVRASALLLLLAAAACADATAPDVGVDGSERDARTPPAIQVWWPTQDAVLSGTQPFKAALEGWQLNKYEMYWQVDGGTPVYMGDSWVDGAHKEAQVDVSAWTWNGAGPYEVRFTARDRKGRVIAERSVAVRIAGGAAEQPPVTPDTTANPGNPLRAASLWVDPYSAAMGQMQAWRTSRPADAAQLEKIALQPQAIWFGDWSGDIRAAVAGKTNEITATGALPVYVAYNIPVRDCSSYSGGGAASGDVYRTWIRNFAAGIGARPAVVILEPDALAGMDCLDAGKQAERLALLADAVAVLKANAATAVYVDAGNPLWHDATETAARLAKAGVAGADGFSLNVSNFHTTAANITYGEAVSAALGGTHFVIDTSRNGRGPTADNQWCNPDGRALGAAPSAYTGHALVDAYLWIKRPGESDGTCNGGPSAGSWWGTYALGLAERSATIVAYGG